MQDVKIKTQHERFKFRVAGIVEHKNKFLVIRMRENPFVCFPGGHVELLEDTKKAVIRELNEELYFEVEVGDLLYIHENFFKAEESNFHELCFYYKATPKNKDLETEDKIWQEIDKGEQLTHEFKWYTKEQLASEWVEPKKIVEKFLKNPNKFEHFVTRD